MAGVIAGPQGLAPEAGLVVLKVFSLRDGCRSARASDVLASVDWVVSNRDTWNVEAINLSLADDTSHRAFCDTEDPAGAATFTAARAAGIAVVAAAGNDGKTSGLPWPACLSNVAAVGMVYSRSSGSVAWGGSASCEDALTGPDVVPCASTSGTGLSVLAPGVGWTTTATGGGRTAIFSGTSAAAPAATGAVLLARQARPLADPALAFDLLRATGVPVLDDRTGRLHAAPRPLRGPRRHDARRLLRRQRDSGRNGRAARLRRGRVRARGPRLHGHRRALDRPSRIRRSSSCRSRARTARTSSS